MYETILGSVVVGETDPENEVLMEKFCISQACLSLLETMGKVETRGVIIQMLSCAQLSCHQLLITS